MTTPLHPNRYVTTAAILCACLTLVAACTQQPDPAKAVEVEFLVERMTCDDCNVAISFELSRIEGVFAAEADYTRGYAKASYDPGFTSPDEMIPEIEKLGYKARVRLPGDRDLPPAEYGPNNPRPEVDEFENSVESPVGE